MRESIPGNAVFDALPGSKPIIAAPDGEAGFIFEPVLAWCTGDHPRQELRQAPGIPDLWWCKR
jgi:hypothetical protein